MQGKTSKAGTLGKALFLCLFTYFMVIACLVGVSAFNLDPELQVQVGTLRMAFFYAAPAAIVVFFAALGTGNQRSNHTQRKE